MLLLTHSGSVGNHMLQRTNGHWHYASIPGKLQKYFHVAVERRKAKVGRPTVGCTLGMCSLLQSPREASGDLPRMMWLLIKSCAAKLPEAMKPLPLQMSSILSLGEKGWRVQCLHGTRNRSSSSQNTLSGSVENLHCSVAHCGLRSQQRALFLPWHLVSPLHTFSG